MRRLIMAGASGRSIHVRRSLATPWGDRGAGNSRRLAASGHDALPRRLGSCCLAGGERRAAGRPPGPVAPVPTPTTLARVAARARLRQPSGPIGWDAWLRPGVETRWQQFHAHTRHAAQVRQLVTLELWLVPLLALVLLAKPLLGLTARLGRLRPGTGHGSARLATGRELRSAAPTTAQAGLRLGRVGATRWCCPSGGLRAHLVLWSARLRQEQRADPAQHPGRARHPLAGDRGPQERAAGHHARRHRAPQRGLGGQLPRSRAQPRLQPPGAGRQLSRRRGLCRVLDHQHRRSSSKEPFWVRLVSSKTSLQAGWGAA